jgi:hypothetical protein
MGNKKSREQLAVPAPAPQRWLGKPKLQPQDKPSPGRSGENTLWKP